MSDAEARTILKGSYDIDQIDECYGGTLIRGPLFSLPGNGRLRPEAVAKGAEPSESGLGGDSAESLNLLTDEPASSPSRGPRCGPSPIKGHRHAAGAASRANGQSGQECDVVAKSLVPEHVSESFVVPSHRRDSDSKVGAVRVNDGLQDKKETEVGSEGAVSQGEQADEKRVRENRTQTDEKEVSQGEQADENETGFANPAPGRRRQSSNTAKDSTVQALSNVKNQYDEVSGAPAPSRSGAGAGAGVELGSGASSRDVTSMMRHSAVCAAVVGLAAVTAAASRSGDSQDIVSSVSSMCTLFASAFIILTYSTRA